MITTLRIVRSSGIRPGRARHRFGRSIPAAMLLIGLAAWGLCDGAIVELGRKGQTAASASSTFRVLLLSGNNFEDQVHQPGDLAQVILGRIRSDIDAHRSFTATTFNDPADPNRNAIDVMRCCLVRDGSPIEPYRVEVFEDDLGIRGAAIEYPPEDARDRVIYRAPDAVNGDGNVRLDLTLVGAGLHTHIVSTAGKTAAQVNAELITAIAADGFATADMGGGNFAVTRPSDQFVKIRWSHTDSGVRVSGVAAEPYTPPPAEPGEEGSGSAVPVLSGWGIVVLALVLAGAALILLSQRPGAGIS